MKHAFERMGRRAVSLLMVVCLMLGMVGTAFAAEYSISKDDIAEKVYNDAVNEVVSAETIKAKVEAAQKWAIAIVANYEAVYEVAYKYAKDNGYIDAAVEALDIAVTAVGLAYGYVAEYEVEAELDAEQKAQLDSVKAQILAEMAATAATIKKMADLVATDKFNTIASSWETILGLKDEMHAHRDALAELGLQLGEDLYPYVEELNEYLEEAVLTYSELVDVVVEKIADEFAACDAEIAAWAEEVIAIADAIDPALGAAVRKFFADSAADAEAILRKYVEEGIAQLFIVAADAAGEIAAVAAALDAVLFQHGEAIYNALNGNTELKALVEDIKAELNKAEDIANTLYNSTVEDALTDVYGQLVYLYEKALPVVLNAVAAVDQDAADALEAALEALTEALVIACEAADGYLGWLADHADAMACELLCAVLENLWELIVTASPIMDQWMYDWLYNHPHEVIGFVGEHAEEIEALIEKYGPAVVGVLSYIAGTYGDDVAEFIMENPCEALDMFMDWYAKYGYRIWPMIDVYLEALGVYDAIENQLGVVNGKLMDLLSELDAHILAQIAALKAALKDAGEEMYAQIMAEIEALYEQLMAFLKANISAKYVVGPNSYYVALGDAGAYGPAADKLAAELGMTDKYANLTFADASASEVLAALNAAEIAKADLITLGFGANTFTAAVAADVMNAVFGEIVAKDWAALAGTEGAAAIEAALAELTAYVAEEVGDESVAALLTAAVESFAYTYINHLVDYVVVSEAIHEINADALLVLVGMHNPMDGVVIDLDGEQLDLGEYVNYLVMLTNIYSFGYALIAEDTIYVDAPAVETNYDGAVMDIMTFVSDLLGFEEAVVKYQPTDAGYKYIQEQIYNALNPTLYEEEEACKHGAPANLKFVWGEAYTTCVAVYNCSICGEALTKECLVTVETKEATAEETGLMTYTASVEIAGKTYTDVKTVILPKLDTPDTGDTTMIGAYVAVMLVAAAGAIVVLKKKKHA